LDVVTIKLVFVGFGAVAAASGSTVFSCGVGEGVLGESSSNRAYGSKSIGSSYARSVLRGAASPLFVRSALTISTENAPHGLFKIMK
jgi:hypothetical protein